MDDLEQCSILYKNLEPLDCNAALLLVRVVFVYSRLFELFYSANSSYQSSVMFLVLETWTVVYATSVVYATCKQVCCTSFSRTSFSI